MYISVSGVSGNVSINGNGDREADYALLDMDPKTGRFDVRSITYIRCEATKLNLTFFLHIINLMICLDFL